MQLLMNSFSNQVSLKVFGALGTPPIDNEMIFLSLRFTAILNIP